MGKHGILWYFHSYVFVWSLFKVLINFCFILMTREVSDLILKSCGRNVINH